MAVWMNSIPHTHGQVRCRVGNTRQKQAVSFFFSAQARPRHAIRHAAAVQTADAGAAYAVATRTRQRVPGCQRRQQHGLICVGDEGQGLGIDLDLKRRQWVFGDRQVQNLF